MKLSRLTIYLVLLLLASASILLALMTDFSNRVLTFSAIGLLFYSLLEIVTIIIGPEKILPKLLKTACLALIFSGLTLLEVRDAFRPVFVKTEAFSETLKNINYKDDGGPHHNIYFKTKLSIEKPINLKIKDSYSNLSYQTDYDILDKKIVFINYAFGNRDEINQAIANQGLVFTYETRDWKFGEEYKLFEQRQNALKDAGGQLQNHSKFARPLASNTIQQMEANMNQFNTIYLILALVIILLQAFVMPILGVGGFEIYKSLPWYDKVRKFIEQFLSTTVGFVVFYYLLRKGIHIIDLKQYTLFSITDILLLIISLLGLSGFLSYAVFKTAANIDEILKAKK
jgi:hypothetical protein